jgi:hypothetical protein
MLSSAHQEIIYEVCLPSLEIDRSLLPDIFCLMQRVGLVGIALADGRLSFIPPSEKLTALRDHPDLAPLSIPYTTPELCLEDDVFFMKSLVSKPSFFRFVDSSPRFERLSEGTKVVAWSGTLSLARTIGTPIYQRPSWSSKSVQRGYFEKEIDRENTPVKFSRALDLRSFGDLSQDLDTASRVQRRLNSSYKQMAAPIFEFVQQAAKDLGLG